VTTLSLRGTAAAREGVLLGAIVDVTFWACATRFGGTL
jgi:hypothetical protein